MKGREGGRGDGLPSHEGGKEGKYGGKEGRREMRDDTAVCFVVVIVDGAVLVVLVLVVTVLVV